jgi:hypothetical protein
MRQLTTPSEVIDALGGNRPVAELCSTPDEPVTGKAVSNWRKDGLPAKTYIVIQTVLKLAKCEAPDSVWNVIPASYLRRQA